MKKRICFAQGAFGLFNSGSTFFTLYCLVLFMMSSNLKENTTTNHHLLSVFC